MNEDTVRELLSVAIDKLGVPIPRNTKNIDKARLIEALINEDNSNLAKELGYSRLGDGGFKGFRDKIFLSKPKIIKSYRAWLLYTVGYRVCTKCVEVKPLSYYSRNIRDVNYKVHTICKECDSSRHKIYYKINKTILNISSRNHYYIHKYMYFAKKAKYRATKLKATPKWANLVTIKEIYQTCPPGYHVDHIVPLQGKLVCGLHCEFNLQHLPASENLSKGNKFEVD
jgi:hypothetical protein